MVFLGAPFDLSNLLLTEGAKATAQVVMTDQNIVKKNMTWVTTKYYETSYEFVPYV